MKLKRYVLVGFQIFEVDEQANYHNGETIVFRPKYESYNITLYKNEPYKTSDNILDLFEVGDMVQDNCDNVLKVTSVMHDTNGDKVFYCILDTWEEDEVTAIYKRQPNGDYKRYEVK